MLRWLEAAKIRLPLRRGGPMTSGPHWKTFTKPSIQLVANALTVGAAFGCEAWLSGYGAILSIIIGGLCFILSAFLFATAQDLPRLARPIAACVLGKRQQVFSGLGLLVVAVLVTDSRWRADAPEVYEVIELGGALMIAACFFGRTWFHKRRLASITSSRATDSGQVFLFTCLGVAGMAAQSGGLLITFMAFMAATFIFSPLQQFGEHAPSRQLDRTAFLFLAIPIADGAEWLQAAGHLPVLVRLP
jgi:hypothetical protein